MTVIEILEAIEATLRERGRLRIGEELAQDVECDEPIIVEKPSCDS